MEEEGKGLCLRDDVPYIVSIEILQLTWQNQKELSLPKHLPFLSIEYS
jgi:hypothetical protein